MTEVATTVTRYRVDKSSSSFSVRVFPTGILASLGHSPTIAIRDFSGEIRFSPGDPSAAGLSLAIQAASLEVADDMKSSDRREIEGIMRKDVLEVDKYPEIWFESARVTSNQIGEGRYQAAIQGQLALHGVTQTITIPGQVSIFGDTLRASGEFLILQSQYAIKPVVVAGGTLKLKDELKAKFDMVAQAQD